MKLEAGDIFVLTNGEYSDYCIIGHFRALKQLETWEVVADFKKLRPGEDRFSVADEFLTWLIGEGFVEEIENIQEWHRGCYGELTG